MFFDFVELPPEGDLRRDQTVPFLGREGCCACRFLVGGRSRNLPKPRRTLQEIINDLLLQGIAPHPVIHPLLLQTHGVLNG